jgi:hypothetical protein
MAMCAKPIMALRRMTMLVFNPRAAVVSIDRAKEGSAETMHLVDAATGETETAQL